MIKNKHKIPGSADRLVELVGIAKNVIAGIEKEKDFEPLNELDKKIFEENLKILRSGNEVEIPNDIT